MRREERVFETSIEGLRQLRPAIERQMRQEGMPLDPPTRDVRTVAGVVEQHPHTEETLETEEDRQAWADYQAALQELDSRAIEATTRYILLEGIVTDDPSEEWAERQRFFGLDVAEHALERKLQYIQRDVLLTTEDIINATKTILTLSAEGDAALQERVALLEDTFRRALAGQETQADQPAEG